MIRAGQMLIAHTMIKLQLNQYRNTTSEEVQEKVFSNTISLFLDNGEEDEAPFSIQNIIPVGEKLYNKAVGVWFGANSVSHCLKVCHEEFNNKYNSDMDIKVFSEGIIYEDEIDATLSLKRSLLLIIPQRLGLKEVDPVYFPQIKEILS
mmetsp:Transcript_13672/g.12126  ORF Transcript_13672/g.12126 Transcript_13672/m.12126 type:complete len:149 (+) Transcript_13672:304-750(+)